MKTMNMIKKIAAVAIAAVTFAFTPSAWANQVSNVSYIGEDGKKQACEEATVVEAMETTWSEGWYVVTGNVTMNGGVIVSGNVKLILADGCKLTVQGGNSGSGVVGVYTFVLGEAGIRVSGDGNSLTIYGQTNGTGELTATGDQYGAGIGGDNRNNGISNGNNITINGGIVTAIGGTCAAGIGGGGWGATGYGMGSTFSAGSGNNITINGGTVTAIGGSGFSQGWGMWTMSYSPGSGIGGGGTDTGLDGSTRTAGASGIMVSTAMTVLAGDSNPPEDEIVNGGGDLASALACKLCVVVKGPEKPEPEPEVEDPVVTPDPETPVEDPVTPVEDPAAEEETQGDLVIKNMKVQQRYPWDGKIDISYEIVKVPADCNATMKVTATDLTTGTEYVATTLSTNLLGRTVGTHSFVWDFDAQGIQLKSERVKFTITASNGVPSNPGSRPGSWRADNNIVTYGEMNSTVKNRIASWNEADSYGKYALNGNTEYTLKIQWPAENYNAIQVGLVMFNENPAKGQTSVAIDTGWIVPYSSGDVTISGKNKDDSTASFVCTDDNCSTFSIKTGRKHDKYYLVVNVGSTLAAGGSKASKAHLAVLSDALKTLEIIGDNQISASVSTEVAIDPSASSSEPVVEVKPSVPANATLGGVFTNGVEVAMTDDKYVVNTNAEVSVVFNADAGYGFDDNAASKTVQITASDAMNAVECAATTALDQAITKAEMTHGTVEVAANAKTDETVSLTVTPEAGYELESMQVLNDANEPVVVTDGTFTMPAGGVNIKVTFAAAVQSIAYADMANGSVAADGTAKTGEKVTLKPTSADGYALRMITVTGSNGEAIALDADNSFIMPVGGVTIAATFADARFEGKVRLEPNSTYIYSMTVPENVWNAENGEFLQALVRLYTGDGCALAFASALTGEGTTTATSAGFSAKSEMAVAEGLRKTTITFKTGNATSYAAFSADSVGADFGEPDSAKRAAAQRALKFATLSKATISAGGTVMKSKSLVVGIDDIRHGGWSTHSNSFNDGVASSQISTYCATSEDGLYELMPNSEYIYTIIVPAGYWNPEKGQFLQTVVRVYSDYDSEKQNVVTLVCGSTKVKAATDPCQIGYVNGGANGYNTGCTSAKDAGYTAEATMTTLEDGSVKTEIVMVIGDKGGKFCANFLSSGVSYTDATKAVAKEAIAKSTLVSEPVETVEEVANETESTFACGEDLGDASVTSTETWLTGFDVGAGLWSDASATLLTEEDAYSTDGVALFTPQATQSETPAYVKEILGLDASAALTTDITESDDTDKIAVAAANVNVETSGDLFDVSFALDKVEADGSPIETNIAVSAQNDGLSVDLTKGNPTGYYRSRVIVKQRNGKFRKEVPAENIVGVIKQTQAVTNAIVSVPWANIAPGEDQDIPVSKILKTDSLSDGDEIRVYAPGSSTYKSYTLQNGVWGGINTLQVSGIGQSAIKAAQSSDEVTLPRGSAIWLIRKDPKNPYYLCGQSNGADASKVEVVRGPNLIGATGTGDYYFNEHILNAQPGDTIMVPQATSDVPKRFEFKDGSWGYMKGTVTEKTVAGRTIRSVKNTWTTNESFVPAGTGFWLFNNSGKITVK